MKFGVVQIQFRLTEKANSIVQEFMVRNKIGTKAEAVNMILERYGGVD